MGIVSWFNSMWNSGGHSGSTEATTINPASGLPMMGGIGGIDVGGNTYGSSSSDHHYSHDWHNNHSSWDHHSSSHDHWSSSSGGSFGSGSGGSGW